MKRNGYFTFQTIIDIDGVRGTISDAVCVGSPVIIKLFTKKLTNKYTKKLAFSTRVGTLAHR